MKSLGSQESKETIHRFRRYGLFGGAALGVLVGVLVSGPHFAEWAAAQSLAVIGGFMGGTALFGYLLLPQLSGALAGDGHAGSEQDERTPARSGGAGPEIGNSGD
jgi:hypothetical protein